MMLRCLARKEGILMSWHALRSCCYFWIIVLPTCATGACWGQAHKSAKEPTSYRISVWIVRPVLNRLPKAEEIRNSMPKYCFLKLDEPTSSCRDDNELLEKLRKQ